MSLLLFADALQYARTNPHAETIRFKAYASLRKKMSYLVKQQEQVDSKRGWLKVFERWQQFSKIEEHKNLIFDDPLIPSNRLELVYSTLVDELSMLEGMSREAAVRVATEITDYSCKLSKMVQTSQAFINDKLGTTDQLDGFVKVQRIMRRVYDSNLKTRVVDQELEYVYRLELSLKYPNPSSFVMHEINEDRALQLYDAWKRAKESNKDEAAGKASEPEIPTDLADMSSFWQDVYCLLLRYKALEGYGYQAGITNPMFECLQKHFGVVTECFASPLNCYHQQFCSPFSDTDAAFGSQGSFFNDSFRPVQGSFQANPPFSAELIKRAMVKISTLLDEAEQKQLPLSFCLVIPAWEGEDFWTDLLQHKHLRASIIAEASQHCYHDGGSYNRAVKDRDRLSAFATGFIFLQSEVGVSEYPLTDQAIAALQASVQAGVPAAKDRPYGYLRAQHKEASAIAGDNSPTNSDALSESDVPVKSYVPKKLRVKVSDGEGDEAVQG
jgi:hypothetical protein